jgi:hypothetical protein
MEKSKALQSRAWGVAAGPVEAALSKRIDLRAAAPRQMTDNLNQAFAPRT